MTSFEQRKDTSEKKFAHDNELDFKISARRNHLFGEWVAAQLGKNPDEIDAYVASVVDSDFKKPGDDDVIEKVVQDYAGANIAINMDELRAKFEAFEKDAREQIYSE